MGKVEVKNINTAITTELVLLHRDKDARGDNVTTWLFIYPDEKTFIHCVNEFAGSPLPNFVEVTHRIDIADMCAYLIERGYESVEWAPTEGSLRNFVTEFLLGLRDRPAGEYESELFKDKYPGRGAIKLRGVKRGMDMVTVDIIRVFPGGKRGNGYMVYDVLFTDESIEQVVGIVEKYRVL